MPSRLLKLQKYQSYFLQFFLTLIGFLVIVFLAAKATENNSMKPVLADDPNFFSSAFDSWNLCISALSFSGYDESKSMIWNAVMAPRLIGTEALHPCEILERFVREENFSNNYSNYSRYWHGSGSIFILLSSSLSLEGFQFIFYLALLFSSLYFLSTYKSSAPLTVSLILFFFTLVLGTNHFLFRDNFVHVFPLISALILAGVAGRKKDDKKDIVIVIAGMWANFLDLLTTPILFFSIPAFVYLIPILKSGYKKILNYFIKVSILWFGAFFSTWLFKWVIAEIFGARGEFMLALRQSFHRINGAAFNDSNPSFIFPTILNFQSLQAQPTSPIILKLLFAATFSLLLSCFFCKSFSNVTFVIFLTICFTTLIICWYAILRNHSLIHSWFTFRALAVIPAIYIGYSSFYVLDWYQSLTNDLKKI